MLNNPMRGLLQARHLQMCGQPVRHQSVDLTAVQNAWLVATGFMTLGLVPLSVVLQSVVLQSVAVLAVEMPSQMQA
ncbi:MAG: hypothetical protein EOO41_00670, partial [Methanobacteriota archaeon]